MDSMPSFLCLFKHVHTVPMPTAAQKHEYIASSNSDYQFMCVCCVIVAVFVLAQVYSPNTWNRTSIGDWNIIPYLVGPFHGIDRVSKDLFLIFSTEFEFWNIPYPVKIPPQGLWLQLVTTDTDRYQDRWKWFLPAARSSLNPPGCREKAKNLLFRARNCT